MATVDHTASGQEPGLTPEQEMLNWGRLLLDGIPFADMLQARDRPDNESWLEYWMNRAAEYEELGDKALAEGHGRTAGEYFYIGSLAAQYGQFLWFGPERAVGQERKAELYRKAAPLLDPPAEPVDLTVDGVPLRAYLRLPKTTGRHPAVVMLGGLESTKEESRQMEDLVLDRGMATVTFDGPGQGDTFAHRELSGDFERFTSAVIDYLITRADIDASAIGVLGRSLGGNYALKSAACDQRIAACVSWGGFSDMDEWEAETPLTKESWRYVSKTESLDEARDHVRRALETRHVLGQIRCPTYILHGADDEIPLRFVDTARELIANAPLTVIVEEDGDHCCHNLGPRPRLEMADWLHDQLVKRSGHHDTERNNNIMAQIRSVTAANAPLESWQPEGVTILDGSPDGHGFTLVEQTTSPAFGAGVFACQPATTTYELTENELIYVLQGSASIALDDGEPVEVTAGELAFLPKGHLSTWTFHSPFKEVWFLVE